MTATRPKTRLLLADLRKVGHNPPRSLDEALRTARRQAKSLLLLTETYQPPVDPTILLADPSLELRYTAQLRRVSGLCRWVGWRYVIAINRLEPHVRQRFTVFHELKHAIDGARTTHAINRFSRDRQRTAAEYVADFFASCVLMPEPWLLDHADEFDDVPAIARRFGVSRDAMRIRLETLDLDSKPTRAKVGER